ncbi:MAG: hypothetical protein ACRDPY_00410 [Streptosporangiaceae bacterium]
MIAQVIEWEVFPAEDRQWEIDAAKTVEGVLNVYHLVNPFNGSGLTVLIMKTGTDLKKVKAAIEAKSEEVGWHRDTQPPKPKSELVYQVLRHG